LIDADAGPRLAVDDEAPSLEEVARRKARVDRLEAALAPEVIGLLEAREEVREDGRPLVAPAARGTERRGGERGLGREPATVLIHVQADAQADGALRRLGEHSRDLPPVDENVVGPLDPRFEPGRGFHGLGGGNPADEGELGDRPVAGRLQEHGDEDGGAGRSGPAAPEAPPTTGLLVAEPHRALTEAPLEETLGRLARLPVEKRASEAASEERLDRRGCQRVGHAPNYTTDAVQPAAAPVRQTEQDPPIRRILPYGRLSDVDLVSKARNGDGRALDALVERHAPRVNRLAAQLMGDLEEARDAAQESLVKLCTRLRQFRGESQFGTWLHRLVVNTCRDRLARQRIRQTEPLALEEEPAGEDSDPSRAALLADKRRELAAALARLTPNQRLVVVLRDVFGMTYEEISRAASMPVGTAKCYVHRARARLRVRLEETASG
jgi:RNA polymerase sigma-70 factor (ECF subfamily)